MTPSQYITFKDNAVGDDLWEFWINNIDVNLGRPYVLMGDSFLREYYVYHDAANEKVGFFGKTAEGSKISTLMIPVYALIFLISVTI